MRRWLVGFLVVLVLAAVPVVAGVIAYRVVRS